MKWQRDDARPKRFAAHDEADGRPDRSVGATDEAHCDRPANARAIAARSDDAKRRAFGSR